MDYVKFLLLFIYALGRISVLAQNPDTILWLEEIAITGQPSLIQEADTIALDKRIHLMKPISELLRLNGNIYSNNFGPGSSSTLSVSGGKSSEVALVWNGIQLSNPMLGVNDYSMISTVDFSSLRVAGMDASSIYGAGSVAGAILMDQQIEYDQHPFEFSGGWSTLNQFKATARYSDSGGWWKSNTTISAQRSKNNFLYTDLNGGRSRLPHAQSEYINANHHSRFQNSRDRYWTVSVWTRKHNREIPPTLTEVQSRASQSDDFFRSTIQYAHRQPKHWMNFKGYFGHQDQEYKNPLIRLHARHRFQNGQFRMDNQWQWADAILLKYGVAENYFTSRSDNYTSRKEQNRFSLYGQLQYTLQNIPLSFSLFTKPEWVTGQQTGWTYKVKIKYKNASLGQLALYGGENIVWPTLNDLYWNPGGNPDLVPEQNWMAGISWDKIWVSDFHSGLTVFHRYAKNWIQWIPVSQGLWKPENAKRGQSFGVKSHIARNINKKVSTKVQYQYIRTFLPGDSPRNLQTVYTPRHMGVVQLNYEINKNWFIHTSGTYTSTRYVTRDHSFSLAPYMLWNGDLTYESNNKRWLLAIQLHNILNKDYNGIQNRPMPGRQIEIITRLKL